MKNIKAKWTSDKSVKLTIVIAWIFVLALLLCMAIAPVVLSGWFGSYETGSEKYNNYDYGRIIMISFYICCPAAGCCLFSLLKLLINIKKENVFIKQNINLLRILSWCCFYVTAVTFVSSFYYIPFIIVFASSGFLGLILRVVKNVMAKATEIKDENDLTV